MGYTHYWERRRALPRPLFVTAANDCRRLCAALAIPLGGAEGKGRPVFNSSRISFNGHVHSGLRSSSIQNAEGLIWPARAAQGVALVGGASAVVGRWYAGPSVSGRVLGPAGDGSYEPFVVERIRRPRHAMDSPERGWWSNYCKTNYRPYDLCVQGCLIVLSHHLGNELFSVGSDGESRDWDDARQACQQVLGYGSDWGEEKLAPAVDQANQQE